MRRSGIATAAGVVAIAVVCAALNRFSAVFTVTEGVTLVFPPAALAVVAPALLGWWGVLGVFLGFLVSPWGLSTTLARAVFFALAATVQAVVPALARFEPVGTTARRLGRVVLFGAVLNMLASAALGVSGVVWLGGGASGGDIALAASSWFFGDATAAILLGMPLLLLLRPRLLLDDVQHELFRRWLREWGWHAGMLVAVAAIVTGMVVAGRVAGSAALHWVAVFLIGPVLACAARGAVGAGLLANGLVSVTYVAAVLHLIQPETRADLFREVLSSYLNLAAFAAAAGVAGVFAGRAHGLVSELEQHRRLLQDSFERVVTGLAAAIEAKDATTQGHVQRVARLALAVGREMGITGSRAELLRYAAILHDVGKIGVPEAILNKPGELDERERELMERHVAIGVEILRNVDILRPAIPAIRYHQERWDGRTDCRYPGYYGLKGEAIPIEARIIATVDAFDAMTSDRPYRRAMSAALAVAELRREAGKQFDPHIVEVLLAVLEGRAAHSSGHWPILRTTAEPAPSA